MGFERYEQKESMEAEVVPVEADGPSMENRLMEVTKESRNAKFAQRSTLFGSVQNIEISQ
jgi:hypothetical protein